MDRFFLEQKHPTFKIITYVEKLCIVLLDSGLSFLMSFLEIPVRIILK